MTALYQDSPLHSYIHGGKAQSLLQLVWSLSEKKELFFPDFIGVYAFGSLKPPAIHLFEMNEDGSVAGHRPVEDTSLKDLRRELLFDTPRGEARSWWFLPAELPADCTETIIETGHCRRAKGFVRTHSILGNGLRIQYEFKEGGWQEQSVKREWTT